MQTCNMDIRKEKIRSDKANNYNVYKLDSTCPPILN